MEQKRPWRPRREAPCAGATRDAWDGADSSASERRAGGAGTAARRGCRRGGSGSGSAAASALCLSVLLAGAWAQNTTEQMPYYAPMDYAVVGQAKSGTSSLWSLLSENPLIKWVGHTKETFHLNTQFGEMGRCENSLEELQRITSVQRTRFNRSDIMVGDWSSTYFTCSYCPVVLKMVNPNIKIILMLRDPVARFISRFTEQKLRHMAPFRALVVNHTFGSFVDEELPAVQSCLDRATLYERWRPARAPDQIVGWAAGLDLAGWLEMQCYQKHKFTGWSVYDKHLENYMAHFPPSQLLVLYTDDLAAQPLETLRRVEGYLGAPAHNYSNASLHKVYNSRECYDWRCSRTKAEIRPHTAFAAIGLDPADPTYNAGVDRLRAFFRPHMQRLFAWADAGRIPPVPPAWRTIYA